MANTAKGRANAVSDESWHRRKSLTVITQGGGSKKDRECLFKFIGATWVSDRQHHVCDCRKREVTFEVEKKAKDFQQNAKKLRMFYPTWKGERSELLEALGDRDKRTESADGRKRGEKRRKNIAAKS